MQYHIDTTLTDHALTWMHGSMTPVTVVAIVAMLIVARSLFACLPRRRS